MSATKPCPWLTPKQWTRLVKRLQDREILDLERVVREFNVPSHVALATGELLSNRGYGHLMLRTHIASEVVSVTPMRDGFPELGPWFLDWPPRYSVIVIPVSVVVS